MGENRAVTFTPADVRDAADRVIAARDFCGGERQAFEDFCDDYALAPTAEFRGVVFGQVERRWNVARREAGVRL